MGSSLVWTRVSNGTGFFCPAGQRDRSPFIVPGQRDNGTDVPSLSRDKGTTGQAQNLAMGRDGPGQSVKIRDGTRDGTITLFLSKSGTGHGTERDNHYFLPIISYFRTSFPVLEHPFLFYNILFWFGTSFFLFWNVLFLFFGIFWESDFVLVRAGTEDFVPGRDRIFAPALVPGQRDDRPGKNFLSRDKGTKGQGKYFVPGNPRKN